MDKSWMHETNRLGNRYAEGVKEFISMARNHADGRNRIKCPCRNCTNRYYKHIDDVEDDLFLKGIDLNYTQWIFHGEDPFLQNVHTQHNNQNANVEDTDDVEEMLDDIYMGTFPDANMGESSTTPNPTSNDHYARPFDKLWEDAQRELYPGCKKFSKLAFIVKLLHIKTICNWSDKSFDMVIDLIKKALPDGESLPRSYYEAKRFRKDLGFSYELIHACENDCVLFWKEYADEEECPKCKTSRWTYVAGTGTKIPRKVLRYFPIKPRLQRLFMSKEIANDMKWHKNGRVDDGNSLRHPADSIAWKEFDKEHSWFAEESRNVRLGLASDGFNPFGNMSTSYSMWPVVLMPYNLPPWRCMKDPYMLLSLLIPGSKAPGNEIDVYLQPLVEDLQELWNEGTLLNIDGKTKDSAKARKDLCHMGIRKELHLQTNGTSTSMPHAKYTLSKAEKTKFFDWLKCVKFPDGYASNISRCVNTQKAVHLPREAELAGPVQFRWMYPIERFMGKLKRFVRNRAHPEGSIAEGYLSVECLTFCSMYLRGIHTRWSPEERNNDGWQEEMSVGLSVFSQRVRPLGAAKTVRLDNKLLTKARWFHTKDRDRTRRTQNSGITVPGEHESTTINYYGELRNILELHYMGRKQVYLFECDWWDIGNRTGMQKDEHFTSVNTSRTWYESDPFILACQASQVFYLNDTKLGSSWKVVQNMSHRNIYDIPIVPEGENEEDDEDNSVGENAHVQQEIDEDSISLHRDDVPAVELEADQLKELIAVDEVFVELDGSTFFNDDISSNDEIESDKEEESPSNDKTNTDKEEESPSNDEFDLFDDDM
uniref:Transposase-associated domain-containing protein n=1 Tax=Fagus sylvatica TaxID=28930 RepID=A0A2N9GAQ5_FAGSY